MVVAGGSCTSSMCIAILFLYKFINNPLPEVPPLHFCDHWTAPLLTDQCQENAVSLFHFSTSISSFDTSNNMDDGRRKLLLNSDPSLYAMLVILLANDIATNPGPYKIKYPCVICDKAAKYGQQAIECENCEAWFHRECLGMNENTYKVLVDHPSYSWSCCNCGMPNFDDSFFTSTSIELSNSFGSLSSISGTIDFDDSLANIETTGTRNPATSSPILSAKQRSMKTRKAHHQQEPLKILHLNCQSVKAKLANFQAILDEEDPDIVVGTESWLNKNIATGEIFPSHFNVFRKDRASDSHGGVFIAIKNILIASEEKDLDSNCETLWVSIHVKGRKPMYVGAFYRPETTNTDYLRELDKSLVNIPKSASIWLLGDFNLPDIDWETNSFRAGGRYPACSKTMLEIAEDHNLIQVIDKPTRGNNILDLCFVTHPSFVANKEVIAGISDHDAIFVKAKITPKATRPPRRKIFLYTKADFSAINEKITAFGSKLTEEYVAAIDTEKLWQEFQDVLQSAIDSHIPSKMSSTRYNLPWVDSTVRRSIRKKQRLYNKARKSGSRVAWEKFKHLRRSIDKKIKKAHQQYVHEVIGESLKSENTKPFWSYIKSKKQEVFGISTLLSGDHLVSLASEKAQALNNQFCSVFTKENIDAIPSAVQRNIPDIDKLGYYCEWGAKTA